MSVDPQIQDLMALEALVRKWSSRINLVAKGELDRLRTRHIADSEQMFHVKRSWCGPHVDLGSGGGFPALPIAILKSHAGFQDSTTLIEADKRKSAFLNQASTELGLKTKILAQRIEAALPQAATTVTARALAPLPKLLSYVHRHLAPGGTALLHKGARWKNEIEDAKAEWTFDYDSHQSRTNPEAVILEIRSLRRVTTV